MSNNTTCLVSEDRGMLQIPYKDYTALMTKAKEMDRIRQVKNSVVANLQDFLGGNPTGASVGAEKPVKAESKKKQPVVKEVKVKEKAAPAPAPVEKAVEVAPVVEEVAPVVEETAPVQEVAPAAVEPVQPAAKAPSASNRSLPAGVEIPPIKKDISIHFNKLDESGRLFNVFKQYYACLNDACGGTVRVTMKDGFCSLWNYDEWEEFAFVDIFEGQLRVALDPRYTNALQSLNLCEVPRLLSSRRNLTCVQVDGLNNTMLDVLVKAFEEVGLAAS